jgi:hypothetical protein
MYLGVQIPVSKEVDTLNCGTNCEGPGLSGIIFFLFSIVYPQNRSRNK